jgi:hypothetical protein
LFDVCKRWGIGMLITMLRESASYCTERAKRWISSRDTTLRIAGANLIDSPDLSEKRVTVPHVGCSHREDESTPTNASETFCRVS